MKPREHQIDRQRLLRRVDLDRAALVDLPGERLRIFVAADESVRTGQIVTL